jgi:hypothetical protein
MANLRTANTRRRRANEHAIQRNLFDVLSTDLNEVFLKFIHNEGKVYGTAVDNVFVPYDGDPDDIPLDERYWKIATDNFSIISRG